MMSNEPSEIHVLMMPDYSKDNPYQTLLKRALEDEQVMVDFPKGYRRILPISRSILSQSIKINILHIHWINPYLKGENLFVFSVYSLKFLLDILIARMLGVKIIWTIHNRVSHESKFIKIELWVRQALSRIVHSMIIHNQSYLSEIASDLKISEKRFSIISYGNFKGIYDCKISKDVSRNYLQIDKFKRVFLHQGNLRPYKGTEQLITAWRQWEENAKDSILIIVGQPLNDDYAEKLKKDIDLTKSIIFIPEFIPDNLLGYYYSAADIAVLPFTQITSPSSLILAMSFSIPVIAPKIGAIQELLGETASSLLYDHTDPNGLMNSLNLSETVDLVDLSLQIDRSCDKLSWLKTARSTKALYLSNLPCHIS
ncbi:glycosyltransferase family 4 protein [Anabaena azotica]|uniref:glycosyltransferase family 4 protein n=1 Tax=Anabaena azotica TaxID=197653 RepID=UPI0039A41644